MGDGFALGFVLGCLGTFWATIFAFAHITRQIAKREGNK